MCPAFPYRIHVHCRLFKSHFCRVPAPVAFKCVVPVVVLPRAWSFCPSCGLSLWPAAILSFVSHLSDRAVM